MLGITEAANQGDDVEAEFVMGQGEVGFGFGAVGTVVAGTAPLGTAADLEGQAGDGVQGSDRAEVGIVKVQAVAALRAKRGDRLQRLNVSRAWAATGAWHSWNLLSKSLLLFYAPGSS